MPPNVSLVRAAYSSRQRNEVQLEWQVQSDADEGWTGFYLEHQWVSERPKSKGSSNGSLVRTKEGEVYQDWYRDVIQDSGVRSYTVRGLTPTATYQFRITPVNYRTVGYPSAAKTPGTLSEQSQGEQQLNNLNILEQ